MTLAEAAKTNPNAIFIRSGILFDVFNPKVEDIFEEDIAHALSQLCRYGGHSPDFYSVAQHSYLCSFFPGTPQEQLECLMHDGSEAYMVDLPRPIKRAFPEYIRIENNLLEVIFKHYDLNFPLSKHVHDVDDAMLSIEFNAFYTNPDPTFEFWVPKEAKKKFLERFYELKAQIDFPLNK